MKGDQLTEIPSSLKETQQMQPLKLFKFPNVNLGYVSNPDHKHCIKSFWKSIMKPPVKMMQLWI